MRLRAAAGTEKGPLSRTFSELRGTDLAFVRSAEETFGGSSCCLLGETSTYLRFVFLAIQDCPQGLDAASGKTLIGTEPEEAWRGGVGVGAPTQQHGLIRVGVLDAFLRSTRPHPPRLMLATP